MSAITNTPMPPSTVAAKNAVAADFLAKAVNTDLSTKSTDNTVLTGDKLADLVVNEVSETEVDEALDIVNKAAVFEQRSLSFMIDEASGRSVVKVIERNTDQLIRQIPSEELLKVAQDIKRLQEEMGQSLGFLIDRQV